MSKSKRLTSVKISNSFFKLISELMLDTIKIDDHTKKEIKEKIIDRGYYSYISLIRKHYDFLTPLRLMILVDYTDILEALKYYLRDKSISKYDKSNLQNYNLITALHSAEFKLVSLEKIYEMFNKPNNIGVMFHNDDEKFDVLVEIDEPSKITLIDNEGYMYVSTLKKGTYAFESRACSSVTDTKYILLDKRINEYKSKFDRYFIMIPRDANISKEASDELEQNNIKLIYSNYSTIDIVNDVVFMEGILNTKNK